MAKEDQSLWGNGGKPSACKELHSHATPYVLLQFIHFRSSSQEKSRNKSTGSRCASWYSNSISDLHVQEPSSICKVKKYITETYQEDQETPKILKITRTRNFVLPIYLPCFQFFTLRTRDRGGIRGQKLIPLLFGVFDPVLLLYHLQIPASG